jgi:hypothetical protein
MNLLKARAFHLLFARYMEAYSGQFSGAEGNWPSSG